MTEQQEHEAFARDRGWVQVTPNFWTKDGARHPLATVIAIEMDGDKREARTP